MQKKGEIMEKLRQNIKKNYLFTIITSLELSQGIWVLYLAHRGLSLFQIGIVETIYHLSSFCMEIPTGAIADIYGRKTSRVLGRVMHAISVIIMIYGQNIWSFALAFVFSALGNNLESGAGDALIYDSLVEIKATDSFKKVKGIMEMLYQISKFIAFIVGGYLATKSYLTVYQLSFVMILLSIVQGLSFTEPTVGEVERKASMIKTFVHQLVSSVRVFFGNKQLIVVILAMDVFGALFTTEYFYIQSHLKMMNYSEFYIGIVLAVGAVMAAFMAMLAHKLEHRFKLRKLITLSILGAILLFWGMTIKGVEKYAFVFLAGIEGLLYVLLSDYINQMIPSDKRATILSFQSMNFSLLMMMSFPLVGWLGDQYGLLTAFIMIAVISTIALLWLLLIIYKRNYTK